MIVYFLYGIRFSSLNSYPVWIPCILRGSHKAKRSQKITDITFARKENSSNF